MTRKNPLWLLVLLVLTLAGSWLYALISQAGYVDLYRHRATEPSIPFNVQYTDQPDFVSDNFKKAGLAVGDHILATNGVPFTGYLPAFEQVRAAKAGDIYSIKAQKPDGRVVTIQAPLDAFFVNNARGQKLSTTLMSALLQMVFPLLCLVIATWVLTARPGDIHAWLVFFLLQYMQTFFGLVQHFGGWALIYMFIWTAITQNLFAVAGLLFGVTFPERLPIDLKRPWLKWLAIGPLLVVLPLDMFELVARAYRLAAFKLFSPTLYQVGDRIETWATLICISTLCGGICTQYFRATNQDSRRRMRILLLGSQLGLWPIFIIVIIGVARHIPVNQAVSFPIFITALVMFMLFPLSLAYVIIVQRAMDVRLLVRQGTQYALAQGTVRVIRVLLGIAIAMLIIATFKHTVSPYLVFVPLALLFLMRWVVEKRARLWIDKRFFREAYSAEQLLSELSMQAGGFTETRPLLETVTHKISETLHVERVAVLLRSGNTFRLQTATGLPSGEMVMLGENSMAITEMKGRRPTTIYEDRPEEWWLDASPGEREALKELGAEVLLPLPGRTQLMGLIALGPKRSEQPYSRTDLQLLTSVGAQTGLAIENSQLLASLATEAMQRERVNREMEIAAEVQERLFPQEFPKVLGVETGGMCRSQQGVGGDYYDCFLLGRGDGARAGINPGDEKKARLGIAIADVSGKGISAALLMAGLRASLRGQTLLEPGDLGAVVENMNTLLFDASAANRYATFFFAAYDPQSRQLEYVNAGHNPPVVLRRDGDGIEVLRLEACGPVVGLLQRVEFEQRELAMLPGDLFIAFTDGISEAMDADGEEWGEERMIELASAHMDAPVDGMLHVLFDGADRFAGGAPQHDDMTVVLMKLE
jgi:phosphoserine phosphatase RsbU/P